MTLPLQSSSELLPLESWTVSNVSPVTPLPMAITIPLESSKKALLIGIRGTQTTYPEPMGAHSDVETMRTLVIDCYNYLPSNIQVLIDDETEHIQPTRDNILSEIGKLVEATKAGDDLVFYYSGHSMQINRPAQSDEDVLDESCLISCDGEHIVEKELRRALVAPLATGSQLVAVFDTRNSGALPEPEHRRHSRVSAPWTRRSQRGSNENRMFAALNEINLNLPWAPAVAGSTVTYRSSPDTGAKDDVLSTPALEVKQFDSPVAMFEGLKWVCEVDGKSNTGPDGQVRADVVSLSSCMDLQGTTEDERKSMTLTAALVEILRSRPNQSLKDVLINVSHAISTDTLLRPTLRVVDGTESVQDLTRAPSSRSSSLRSLLMRDVEPRKPKRSRSIEHIVELPSALLLKMERQWRM
ncbi:caspase domain-containing protein [Mycena sanguinolenta]|nr:caspase domain-containing protein [Mycena sanguinolenta]